MKTWEMYCYRVFYSQEDREFVGCCAELSGLSSLATTPEAALKGIRRVVRDAVSDLIADGEPVPEPLAARSFSGVFKVRVPPEVHSRLVLDAAEQGVSMNRLITARLTSPADAKPQAAPSAAVRRRSRSRRAVTR